MTDYEKDRQADKRAVGCAPFVWGFVPLILLLALILTFRNEIAFLYYTRIF